MFTVLLTVLTCIVSGILFIASISVKAVILGLRVADISLAVSDKSVQLLSRLGLRAGDTMSKGGNIADKAGTAVSKTSTTVAKTSKVLTTVTRVALKALILALKALLMFLRVLSWIVATFGLIIAILIVIGVIGILAAISGYLTLNSDKTSTETTSTTIEGSAEAEGSSNKLGGAGNGDWRAAIQETAQWYIQNWGIPGILLYDDSRAVYPCDLLDGDGSAGMARPDCSGFARACMRLFYNDLGNGAVGNIGLPQFSSHDLATKTGATATWLLNNGWEVYDIVNDAVHVEQLQPGDVMAKPGHVELFWSQSEGFGWGSEKRDKFPRYANWTKSNNGMILEYANGHSYDTGYTHVWRYVGTGESKSDEEDKSDEE